MKILYINALDKRYGSTYRSRNIVKALRELGHVITYIESNLEECDSQSNISVSQKDNLFGYFKATCLRVRAVLRLDFDILYIQKFIPLTVPCMIAAKLRRKKCIVDWDDLDWALQGSLAKKVIVYSCEFIFPYLCDKITTHSLLLKEYAQKRGIRNTSIVNQIVDFDNSQVTEEDKDRLKAKYNLKDKKVLGYLCTLTEGGAKDIDLIIKWASELINRDNSFFLFIIGGGPLEGRVQNLLSTYNLKLNTNCAITGLISHQDIPEYLSVCDVGLIYMRNNLANRYRMSFKALEYFAVGLKTSGKIVGETNRRLAKYINNNSNTMIEQRLENDLKVFINEHYSFNVLTTDLFGIEYK